MTFEEWAIFIAFTIVINVILQTVAWKIAYKLGTNHNRRKKKNDN